MRKYNVLLVFIVCLICLCACEKKGGNTNKVIIKNVESEMYSQKEIESAINVIKKEFEKDWSGCTLKEIYYAGDSKSKDFQEWADRNNADEVIVLMSSFDVDSSGGDGSFNANSTYDDWNWILVRTSGGSWKHVDSGY